MCPYPCLERAATVTERWKDRVSAQPNDHQSVGTRRVRAFVVRKTTSKKTATRAADSAPANARTIVGPVMLSEQETFVVLCLTIRNTLLGEPRVVAIGTATGVEVHPRDVFRAAVAANAAGIVVLHNHPSGDPTPSVEDVDLTRRLKACGDLLGIPVVDHVVVTADGHASIAELRGGSL